jgi:glycosyltransferase involved in cell wall biosynthesis
VTLVAHEVATPGGMERQLGELASGLLARGHAVTVVARSCGLPEHPALRVVRVRGPRRPFSLGYPWFFVLGSLTARRHGRGLLHTTGALVAARADVSTVHFCHRAFHARVGRVRAARPSLPYRLNARVGASLRELGERYCYRPSRVGRLVAVSEGVASELRELFPAMAGAVAVIPNGVDGQAFRPDPAARARLRSEWGIGEEELVALFVGGEWERKGLRYAIEAVARVPQWRLVVVGAGDADRYRGLASEAGAGGRVRFAGAASDTSPYYPSADAFVFPTAYEAFPLVTLEAASSGLPLLATRVSGVEELLVDGRNGWFVERDSGMIADRLRKLLDDPPLRRVMAENARSSAERFGWERVVDAYSGLYGALDERGPAA